MLLDLVRSIKRAIDPLELARVVGLTPDPWQERFLLSSSKRVLLNCSRQAGKSTVTALLACHEAIYAAPSLTILLSPSQQQSMEIYRKVAGFLAMVPDAPKPLQQNLTRLELSNGSRVISLPGNSTTIRGYSGAGLIVVDEASRVPDELIASARPMLAISDGRLVALSTPAGRRGFFYNSWNSEGWEKITVRGDQVPRIGAEFLASELEAMGPMLYSQEYECQFIDAETAAFDSELIRAAFIDDVKPLRDAA